MAVPVTQRDACERVIGRQLPPWSRTALFPFSLEESEKIKAGLPYLFVKKKIHFVARGKSRSKYQTFYEMVEKLKVHHEIFIKRKDVPGGHIASFRHHLTKGLCCSTQLVEHGSEIRVIKLTYEEWRRQAKKKGRKKFY